jgi:hypothetical protein
MALGYFRILGMMHMNSVTTIVLGQVTGSIGIL